MQRIPQYGHKGSKRREATDKERLVFHTLDGKILKCRQVSGVIEEFPYQESQENRGTQGLYTTQVAEHDMLCTTS